MLRIFKNSLPVWWLIQLFPLLAIAQKQELIGTTIGNGGSIISLDVDSQDWTTWATFDHPQGPSGTLLAYNGYFWGTSNTGGDRNSGTIYRFHPDSGVVEEVNSFDLFRDGRNPTGGLTLVDDLMWGTTLDRVGNTGTIFVFDPETFQLEVVQYLEDAEGNSPQGDLLWFNDLLWGITSRGGASNEGVIYTIDPSDSSFSVVHEFDGTLGGRPITSLTVLDGLIWGTTTDGGAADEGVIFTLDPESLTLTVKYEFADEVSGATPYSGLTESNDRLWGVTFVGGDFGDGTLYSITPEGTDFQVHYHFDENSDGDNPRGKLVPYNGKLYGLTWKGGANEVGTLYSIDTTGENVQILVEFSEESGRSPSNAAMLLVGDTLYGVLPDGGSAGKGAAFSFVPNSTHFELVANFDNAQGSQPYGGLVEANDLLWGTMFSGGPLGKGLLYSLDLESEAYTIVHQFEGTDGANPWSELFLYEGTLYGHTAKGGDHTAGVIFTLHPTTGEFSVVHHLVDSLAAEPHGAFVLANNEIWATASAGGATSNGAIFSFNPGTNTFTQHYEFDENTGKLPHSRLTLSQNLLWGTAQEGGDHGDGVIFTIDPSNSAFQVVHHFNGNEGRDPFSGLVEANGKLWGLTRNGGSNSFFGALYSIDTDGTNYTKVHDFDLDDTNGAYPYGELTVLGDSIWGTTFSAGTDGRGNFFSIDNTGNNLKFYAVTEDEGTEPYHATLLPVQTKFDQQISLIVSDKTYGDAPFELDIVEQSGNPVVFSSSNPDILRVDQDTLATILGTGEVTLTATQAASNAYREGSDSEIITIEKASLTATVQDTTIAFGSAIPVFTIQYSGFVYEETETALATEPTAATTATSTSDAGTYPITLSGGEANNYQLTLGEGTLTIAKADQSISFSLPSPVDVLDETLPLSATASSGLPVTFASSNIAVVTISYSTATLLDRGSITITARQGGNDNYNAAEDVIRILVVTDVTGLGETIPAMQVYPNPARDYLQFSEPVDEVRWYTLEGQLAYETTSPELRMDITHLEANMYFLLIRQGEQWKYAQVQVQE
ncbi:MAG: choice-of-anchor tandem repeat GloVer-containing protein [Bacteroidota bacterium]